MTVPSKRPSLAEFAKSQKPAGIACWLCGIPEREEVEQAILTGAATQAAAWRWLRDACGYTEASANRISNHMTNHAGRAT